MRAIPTQKFNDVVNLIEKGLSLREIARRVGVGRSTVARIRKESGIHAANGSGGRPKIINPTLQRLLVRSLTSGAIDTAAAAHRELRNRHSINVGYQTVRNVLKKSGLVAAKKVKKPLLRKQHIKARYSFARKYANWTTEDWLRVVFSDETKINRIGSDGPKYCWKRPGSELLPQHVQTTIKHGGGSLMIWGCMTRRGVGFCCRIDGGLDKELYCSILEDEYLNTLKYYGLKKEETIFQHDNDPKHTAKKTREWLEENGIEVLDWPAQSPDLNPIEHLWEHLKRKLNSYETFPTSISDLWERVQQEWNEIDPSTCVKLIETMPSRIAAVKKAKGKYTMY